MRYSNPVLARCISADSVVPGDASGGMDGVARKGLTVDFHAPGFAAQLGSANNQSFWFQLSDDDHAQAGSPWGPANPQALNRYAYVNNNPIKHTDPTGHIGATRYTQGYIQMSIHLTHEEANALYDFAASDISTMLGSVIGTAALLEMDGLSFAVALAAAGASVEVVAITGLLLLRRRRYWLYLVLWDLL